MRRELTEASFAANGGKYLLKYRDYGITRAAFVYKKEKPEKRGSGKIREAKIEKCSVPCWKFRDYFTPNG